MVEIDSDTYQVKTVRVENKAVASRFLITPERSQSLDLLQHLLANTHQAIVLCGPEGVGKTALLEVLQQRLKDRWRWCMVNGQSEITFEAVQDSLGSLLRQHRPEASVKHTRQGHAQDAHKEVVLVIDDAGEVAPGLLTRFIQFVEDHPELHLLLVLTHDQWHIKNASDPAIENCYVVEARPLGPKECREFVQYIASLTTSQRHGKALTDDRIDAVYRESHGIPSRIMAHFPELNKPRESTDPLTILIIAVVALVSLALYMQWHTAARPAEEITAAAVQPNAGHSVHFDFRQPVLSLPLDDLLKYAQDSALPGVQDQMPVARDPSGQAVANPQGAPSPVLAPADKPLEEAGRKALPPAPKPQP
ncbi:AAA family ATPase [Methylomicrobium lacus]|uniref:AAA family ATPase n=1 Tax=Methylomicrobium lacus TaxID=136992 RepID=UPI0035A919A0